MCALYCIYCIYIYIFNVLLEYIYIYMVEVDVCVCSWINGWMGGRSITHTHTAPLPPPFPPLIPILTQPTTPFPPPTTHPPHPLHTRCSGLENLMGQTLAEAGLDNVTVMMRFLDG